MCFYSTEEDDGKVFTTAIVQGGTLGGKLIDAFTIEPLGVGTDDDDDRMVDEVLDADSINGRFHHHPYSLVYSGLCLSWLCLAWFGFLFL